MNLINAKQIKELNIVEKILLFAIFYIIIVSPSAAQDSLLILNSSDVPTMLQNVKYIESVGGTVTHRFPPHILIGDIPESQHSNLKGRMNIVEIATKPVDISLVSGYDKTAEVAVNAWNNNYMGLATEKGLVPIKGAPEPGPIIEDMLIVPEYVKSEQGAGVTTQSENLTNKILVQTLPYGAGFLDTSEYMIGDVAVGIIFLESNGAIDTNTENWTSDEESNVISEIQVGLNWWAVRESNAKLSFTYDIHCKVPTGYEAINHSGNTGSPSGQSLWITDAMTNLGYTTSSFYGNVYYYDNAIRQSLDTDWAFTIFVVDSSNDADGKFKDNKFAYAYLGGPFMVMTYKNDGYGIANMDAVTAHEMGHIFYALDQYYDAQKPCNSTSGYLNIENQNSEYGSCISDVASIMRGQISPYINGSIDTYARQQVGWRDNDTDNILDVIDFFPSSTLNTGSHDPTNDSTPTYTGVSTTTTTYPNNNPHGGNNITINKITNFQYRVDFGEWINAVASDGNCNSCIEDFTFTTFTLSDGTHIIEVRAQNTGGNWETVYSSDNLTIDAIPPIISFVSPPTPANNSFLMLNYVNISVISDDNLITTKLEWNGINESIEGSGQSWYKNKTGLSDGHYKFKIWGKNNVNDWNVTQTRTVTLDTRPPIVIANPTIYPANQDAASNGSLITLNATIIDLGTGVKNATVNASQINSNLVDVILINNSGFWTNSSVIINASDGTFFLNITAYDKAGVLNNTVQVTVNVDSTPPTSNSPQDIEFSANSTASFDEWILTDLHPNYYRVLRNDTPIIQPTEWINNTNITVSINTTIGLGNFNYTIQYNDTAGNSGQDTVIIAINDTTSPYASGENPANNSLIHDNTSKISVNIIDNASGINPASIVMRVNGIVVTPEITPIAGGYNISNITVTPFLFTKVVTITINATDNNSNILNHSWSFTINDNAPNVNNPNATPQTIESNGTHTTNLSVIVIDDLNDVVNVTINLTQIGGSASADMTNSNNTYWIITYATSAGNGTYYLPVNATDSAGNSNTSVNITLYVNDTTLPILSGKIPSTGTTNLTPTISINATDRGSGINANSAEMTADGMQVQIANISSGFTFNFTNTTSAYNHGDTVNVTFNVSDNEGHTAKTSWLFYIDNLTPTVIITSPTDGDSTTASSITVSGSVIGTGSPPIITVNDVIAVNTTNSTIFSGIFSATASLLVGSNAIYANVTDAAGNTDSTLINITRNTLSTPSGGGGGGGGSSGEERNNILVEKSERINIFLGDHVSYSFEDISILYVNFTSKTSVGWIKSTIEVLKNTSTQVNTPPPLNVYKNVNIWVGLFGWANEQSISNASISFKVPIEWIKSNNIDEGSIKLYRYNNNTWNPLPTTRVNQDEINIFYNSPTPGFSPFAITGKSNPPLLVKQVPIPTPAIIENNSAPSDKQLQQFESQNHEGNVILWIVGIIIILSIAAAGFILKKK